VIVTAASVQDTVKMSEQILEHLNVKLGEPAFSAHRSPIVTWRVVVAVGSHVSLLGS
jgi:phosphoribosylcarboxyaminoimidazole (NCAIR) mutase